MIYKCLIWSPRELVVGEHDVVKTGGAVDQNSDSLVLGRDLDTGGNCSDFECGHGDVIYLKSPCQWTWKIRLLLV